MSNHLTKNERMRRKTLVEQCLMEGFGPVGVSGSKGSALEEANRRDGRMSGFFTKWVYAENAIGKRGGTSYAPWWHLYVPPVVEDAADEPVQEVKDPAEHAESRARFLGAELRDLVMSSRFPLINPEAIVVDGHMRRRYNREIGDYEMVESTPRTWLSATLKVAPVKDARGKKFIFTGAQNDADVHEDFWANLQAYAEFVGAEIVVGPYTYETQWWSENNPTSRSYDEALSEHLCFGQMKIGDSFVFCGEMNTLPTASKPISDLVTYSRGRWAVFPHAKRQLKSVPSTDPNTQAHQVMTTGAVTRPKVIPRKAGIKSIFHQVLGAVIVEFDEEGDLFCRQITADEDGTFYDLDRFVSNAEVTTGHSVAAVVCGDLHLRKINAHNAMATFGFDVHGGPVRYKDSVIDVLKPETVLLHDIFDNEARNHHHEDDNAYSYEMAIRGRDSVLDEVHQVGEFLVRAKREDTKLLVVESNHDLGLERYVREGRYRNDGINIRFGLQLEDVYLAKREAQAKSLDAGEPVESFSLLETALRLMGGTALDHVSWVHDGYSYEIGGVEVGNHGFRGANGARGTVSGFARIGKKMSIADKHSPEIDEGVYVAGCMNLRHGYNKGPSSWAVAHIVQYPNGKRTLITLQKGKWRADRPRISVPAVSA